MKNSFTIIWRSSATPASLSKAAGPFAASGLLHLREIAVEALAARSLSMHSDSVPRRGVEACIPVAPSARMLPTSHRLLGFFDGHNLLAAEDTPASCRSREQGNPKHRQRNPPRHTLCPGPNIPCTRVRPG